MSATRQEPVKQATEATRTIANAGEPDYRALRFLDAVRLLTA